MFTIRTTRTCTNTPRVLFALEELGFAYEIETVDDGVFTSTYGSPGPTLHEGDTLAIEVGAILRHLVRRSEGRLWPTTLADQAHADRWFELLNRRVMAALEAKNFEEVTRLFGFVDRQVATGPWLLGHDFTMVDVLYSLMAQPATRARMAMLGALPNLSAYLDRVAARPAFSRALARVVH